MAHRPILILLGALALSSPLVAAQDAGHAGHHTHGAAADGDRPAQSATVQWTRFPLLLPAMAGRGERNTARLRMVNLASAGVRVYAPDGPPQRREADFPVEAGRASIRPTTAATGNYHWLVARQEVGNAVNVASSAWYFSNPGTAPKLLLQQVKHELEIVPLRLPREHGSYRESEKWPFQVRYQGAPLAGQRVTLETEFGSRSTLTTDAQGQLLVLFPRDFPPPEAASRSRGQGESHGRRRAQFVLSTDKNDQDKHYLTAFNYHYTEEPGRRQSLAWGAVFGLIGMAAATPLLLRRSGGMRKET